MGTGLAIAPATLRNYRVSHDFVLVSANGGVNLFIGNNPTARGLFQLRLPGYGDFDNCFGYPEFVRRVQAEVGRPLRYSEVSAHFAAQALHFIRIQPLTCLGLTLRRAALFWGPAEISHNEVIDVERQVSPVLSQIPGNFALVLGLALWGLARFGLDARNARTGPREKTPARRHAKLRFSWWVPSWRTSDRISSSSTRRCFGPR